MELVEMYLGFGNLAKEAGLISDMFKEKKVVKERLQKFLPVLNRFTRNAREQFTDPEGLMGLALEEIDKCHCNIVIAVMMENWSECSDMVYELQPYLRACEENLKQEVSLR